jgi:hypothetical protein
MIVRSICCAHRYHFEKNLKNKNGACGEIVGPASNQAEVITLVSAIPGVSPVPRVRAVFSVLAGDTRPFIVRAETRRQLSFPCLRGQGEAAD